MRIELRAFLLVVKPERTRKIDDARPAPGELRPDLRRQRVGNGKKHNVGFVGKAIGVKTRDRLIPYPLQRRDSPSLGGARAHRQADFSVRVLGEPPQQFDARIPCCPCNTDPDARISIHPNH